MSIPVVITKSKQAPGDAKTKKKAKAAASLPDVIAVSGSGCPFRNGPGTLSKAAWNRLRCYIQIVHGFPSPSTKDEVVSDVLKDLLKGVERYRTIWKGMALEHRQLMISYVRILLFSHIACIMV